MNPNPEEKIVQLYLQNLEQTIESLCKIVNTLIKDDQVALDSYESIKNILNEIKYHEKLTGKPKSISSFLAQTVQTIAQHSQHRPQNENMHLPPVKVTFSSEMPSSSNNLRSLTTIVEKQSEENLIRHFMHKEASKAKKGHNNNYDGQNISRYHHHQKALPNIPQHNTHRTIPDPVNSNSSYNEYEVIRDETKRSLENPVHMNRTKKTLYRDLQKMKGGQHLQMMPAVKDYLDKHNHKKHVVSRAPNYTISKYI